MTIEKSSNSKLFRRPRKPNLSKIELVESIEREPFFKIEIDYDADSDEYTEDDESSSQSDNSPTHAVNASTPKGSSSSNAVTKFPPINRFIRDQHLSIIEEANTINESTGSYENFQLYIPTANPNSPVSPDFRQLYKTPINTRTSMMKSVHSAPVIARRSLLRPYKPLGPDPLPSRAPRHVEEIRARKLYYQSLDADSNRREDEDRFELNDFLLDPSYNKRLVASCVKSISRHNYRQICQMLETQIQEERYRNSSLDVIHVQTLEPNIQPFINRKPMRQSMIEMANYLKNELSKKTGVQLKTKFNALPKWQRMRDGTESELIIYEDATNRLAKENEANQIEEESTSADEITPAHIAIVDCLLRNGLVLSLKAYSIDKLPDLSALKNTLIYINLSYNHFKEFPKALLEMQSLEVIKLRNNPIRHLPDSLGVLMNLKCLVLSYCQLRELSKSVYELDNLNELNVSYNRLEKIDEDIIKLRKLKQLNYEGNELEYLPCCMLKMDNLETINVRNNYLHPIFWRKHMLSDDIQRLEDLAAAKFCQVYGEDSIEFDNLDYKIKSLIKNTTTRCDCCGEKRFGDGIKVIRPCVKIFNVKYLPFLFICCSKECYNTYKNK